MFRTRKASDELAKLTRTQKEAVKKLIQSTGTSEKVAAATLQDCSWDLGSALLRFQPVSVNTRSHAPANSHTDKITELFNRYKDQESGKILPEGVSRFCDDLEVDPADISMLVFSWHCKAATICEFTKEEFTGGCRALRAASVDKLKEQLPKLRAQMNDEAMCREIYNFAFGWAKDKGQKWLGLETAVGMWQLILGHCKWPLLEHWCTFVQEKHGKAISKDAWTQLFEFTRVPMSTLAHYDEEAAWPTLIDDFVTYLQGQGVLPC